MVNVILTEEVRDFATWKELFEKGEPLRTQAGVKVAGVYPAIDNPTE